MPEELASLLPQMPWASFFLQGVHKRGVPILQGQRDRSPKFSDLLKTNWQAKDLDHKDPPHFYLPGKDRTLVECKVS